MVRAARALDSLRFLIVHPKNIDEAELPKLYEVCHKLLLGPNGQNAARLESLTLARDDFNKNFERYDGWNGWCAHVANGVDFTTGRSVYTDYIVWPRKPIGRASAQIISSAMMAHKDVGVLVGWPEGTPELLLAKTVEVINPNDMKAGWVIRLD